MAEGSIDPSHLEGAQRFIEQEAGPRRRLTGAIGKITSALAVCMSLVFLYWAWASVTAQVLRLVFLGLALTLSFLIYPTHPSANRTRIPWHDWLLALASIAVVAYPLWDFEEFIYRAALP
ncbi:MAG: TRAP transporter permease, partial [Candidatus Binatia bacterium]